MPLPLAQWEYHILPLPVDLDEQKVSLDELGAEGWELVHVEPAAYLAYLRRPIALLLSVAKKKDA